MSANRSSDRMAQAIAEAVEAVDAIGAEDSGAPVEAAVTTYSHGGGSPLIYTVMLIISAVAFAASLAITLLWLKEYSDPNQFLW